MLLTMFHEGSLGLNTQGTIILLLIFSRWQQQVDYLFRDRVVFDKLLPAELSNVFFWNLAIKYFVWSTYNSRIPQRLFFAIKWYLSKFSTCYFYNKTMSEAALMLRKAFVELQLRVNLWKSWCRLRGNFLSTWFNLIL